MVMPEREDGGIPLLGMLHRIGMVDHRHLRDDVGPPALVSGDRCCGDR